MTRLTKRRMVIFSCSCGADSIEAANSSITVANSSAVMLRVASAIFISAASACCSAMSAFRSRSIASILR
ncbi:MAG: hypothetical protein NTZ11_18215 [Gammaproteobacteria bacterium]|nr:hypothetical protein [Gammaproteobacteria bacterium]